MIDPAITHISCPGCDCVRELSPAACPECDSCPRCGAKAKAGLPDCGCHLSWDERVVELQEHFGIAAREVPRERLRFEIRQRLERRKVMVWSLAIKANVLIVGLLATWCGLRQRLAFAPIAIMIVASIAVGLVVDHIISTVFRDIEDRMLEEEFDESQ